MSFERGELTPERIVRHIDANFHQPITPRDVASAMNYSLCHLTHLTRKYLGCSVGDLLLKRRLQAARQLLIETGLTVSHVAARVGFTDLAYFSRRFSQEIGASPSQWRKLERGRAQARPFCHACGRVLPSIAAGEDEGADFSDAAS
jgi:AraC-like DNA-binding protein